MHRARAFFIVCAGLLCLSFAHPAAAQLVFDASPTVRVDSNEAKTVRGVLSKQDEARSRVTITYRGGRYSWTSREDKELVYSRSGAFHFFVATDGGGYVKICDQQELPEQMRSPGPRFCFMEHVTLHLSTITYWGSSEGLFLGGEE
jgi:hypothetical protein